MLDKIIDLVKNQVTDTVNEIPGIPQEKKTETVKATANSLVDWLKSYVTPDNIASFTSMLGFGKSGGSPSAAQNYAATNNLESNIVSALTSKVGLDSSVAKTIASSVIPAVMSLFKKKVDDDNEPGFNLESLIGSFSGKGTETSSGDLMNMLGGILGNKK